MSNIINLVGAKVVVLAAAIILASASADGRARTGQIYIVLVKSGKVLSSYGSGTLFFEGRRSRLKIEGINFDRLPTATVRIEGSVSHLKASSDIAGAYRAAAGASATASATTTAHLENKHGVVLELHLIQVDQGVALDLTGMAITPR